MAIYHCHTHAISRAGGKSILGCAAYRSGQKLRETSASQVKTAAAAAAYRTGGVVASAAAGQVHDYSRKQGVEHVEIVVPSGITAAWVSDRERLWNLADAAERQHNSRVAREWRVGLPHELSRDQRAELATGFAQAICDRYGIVADVAVHAPSWTGDDRNFHAHILCTTRQVANEGFGPKALVEWSNAKLGQHGLPYTSLQIRELRMVWEELANEALARAGLDLAIDHRSYLTRGVGLEPRRTLHVGQLYAEARDVELGTERLLPVQQLDESLSERNAAVLLAEPRQLLDLLGQERHLFGRLDVAKALHRYVSGDWQRFERVLDTVMRSRELVTVVAAFVDDVGRRVEPVHATRETFEIEARLLGHAERLASLAGRTVAPRRMKHALQAFPFLSAEQRGAIEHVCGCRSIACVRGVAGSGKTTMLAAVRQAWQSEGRRIVGAALAGKAVEELQLGSGIESRTLASWERSWAAGYDSLQKGDVIVVDEANMVGTRQMVRFLEAVEVAGARVILVGDGEQLQSIEAGAAFRGISDRVGVYEIATVRRQEIAWQRQASELFGQAETAAALDLYRQHDAIKLASSRDVARKTLVADYMAAVLANPSQDIVAFAYRNQDVDALNQSIRDGLRQTAALAEADEPEHVFQTKKGERSFARGDRVMFLANDFELGVKNGTRGQVCEAAPDRLAIAVDGDAVHDARIVEIESERYGAVSHAYALTIHKGEGMTVDRSFVISSPGMDRHLTYVAMTRHRKSVAIYAGQDEFRSLDALKDEVSRSRSNRGIGDYLTPGEIAAIRSDLREDRELELPKTEKSLQAVERRRKPVKLTPGHSSLRMADPASKRAVQQAIQSKSSSTRTFDADATRVVLSYARAHGDLTRARTKGDVQPHQVKLLDTMRELLADALGVAQATKIQKELDRKPKLAVIISASFNVGFNPVRKDLVRDKVIAELFGVALELDSRAGGPDRDRQVGERRPARQRDYGMDL
ncbi:MAG TPA: Ti-type conjugative transfer relaxase TraA [Aurantimonas coralicida]|uniref:Ti-type conjugative transfer relaxase TraA n=2 Tax=root TaxID=1 RepID=A0A9C9NG27_9HYPH|nr:Ti-type conjugative transfer relaxase TraA [Aurantimonas coralicida]HEU00981.1 Ti-type conjugative transfer relaxase TraA [Aurantimonas coralicida]